MEGFAIANTFNGFASEEVDGVRIAKRSVGFAIANHYDGFAKNYLIVVTCFDSRAEMFGMQICL